MADDPALPPHDAASLLLFGAGGHGLVVADAALLSGVWARVQAGDRDPRRWQGQLLAGVDLLALPAALSWPGAVHVAIGDNRARERESAQWPVARRASVQHPAACVSAFARLGAGCFVAAGAIVAPLAQLGDGVIVNHGAVLDHQTQVGDFSHIAAGARLAGAVSLGRRVLVGAGAVILPGLSVADDCLIGAGSVVNRSLAEAGAYVGAPARKIR